MLKIVEKCSKIQLQKHKRVINVKQAILKIGINVLKIIYLPFKLLKIKNKVVYISRQFNNETLDFGLLKNAINELNENVENVILTKRIEKGFLNSIVYIFHIFKQMYHVATAKVVVVDTYCIVVSVLKHKKETKIIQIWHRINLLIQ